MLVQLTLTEIELSHLKTILKNSIRNSEGLDKRFTENLLDRVFEMENFEPNTSLR